MNRASGLFLSQPSPTSPHLTLGGPGPGPDTWESPLSKLFHPIFFPFLFLRGPMRQSLPLSLTVSVSGEAVAHPQSVSIHLGNTLRLGERMVEVALR